MIPEEAYILKQARLFRDMIASAPWQEFVRVLDAQIATRLKLVESPLHDLPETVISKGADLAARAAVMESIKGAVIGLRLARSLPESTISAADDIMHESREQESFNAT
jgi:hypothetical protein